MKSPTVASALAVVFLMFSGATVLQARERVPQPYLEEFRKLHGELESGRIKKQAEEQLQALLEGQGQLVREAAAFFYDIRGNRLLWAVLSDPVQDLETKIYVTQLLAKRAQAGDVELQGLALGCLKHAITPMSGGSEVEIPQARYRYALAKLLEQVTSLQLTSQPGNLATTGELDWDRARASIRGRGLSPEDAAHVVSRAEKWDGERRK